MVIDPPITISLPFFRILDVQMVMRQESLPNTLLNFQNLTDFLAMKTAIAKYTAKNLKFGRLFGNGSPRLPTLESLQPAQQKHPPLAKQVF